MPEASVPVLAIDGPSGAGKGTLCQLLAARLGWHLLDSGALYRLIGLAGVRRGVSLDDGPALARLAGVLNVEFQATQPGEPAAVYLDGEDVSAAVRSETAGGYASRVAVHGELRDALRAMQRAFAKPPGLVADGRDMGTEVFPDAALKIYLTASAEERANRRYKQLKNKGENVNLAALLGEIRERDRRDRERAVAPLRPADDALILDSTALSIDDVLAWVEAELGKRGLR
ncbi:MAG TPA: (d)CMP kinase [Spongiibacteraceae bacterium]|jgi:cytidylate kinase|nr:(d)CMP kinase [Spongiibacteraceae bacterium]HUH36434.1 (d)CMP kinase [Spongiibacteraceae bacterium]